MKPILHHLSQSKFLRLLAKSGLTALALWLVFRKIDLAELGQMLIRQDHVLLFAALVLAVVQMLFCAVRWHLILATLSGRAPIPLAASIRIYTIGAFFTVCLPGTIGGDVVRVFLLKPKMALPPAIHSVIIDRLAALAGLLVLTAATLPWLAADWHFQVLPAALSLAMLTAVGLVLIYKADRWLSRFKPLVYFAANVRLLFKNLPATFVSAAISIGTQFGNCTMAWLLALSFGAHPSLLQCVTLVPPVILAAMLPISVGGWGVREASMVTMLALVGVPHGIALIVSVQLGLLIALAASPGGLLWLKR